MNPEEGSFKTIIIYTSPYFVLGVHNIRLVALNRSWPTFPQVYMNGELVGGADIMLQLHQSGELISELDRIGHRSLLTEET